MMSLSGPVARTPRLARALRALIAGAAFALALGASDTHAETLGDALAAAYTNSELLEQNRALLRAVDEDVAIALSSLRPVVNYAANATHDQNLFGTNFSATLSLSAELVLFDFGRSRLGVELAKESVLSARSQLIGVEQNVLFNAVQVYMNLIRAGEFVALRENNVRLITQELRAARDRFELGEITVTDVSIAEARLALSRANLAAAQGDLQIAREQYLAFVGRKPGTLAPPPAAPATAASLEEAKNIALRTHPSLASAQRQVNIGELNIAIVEAAMKPSISAGASAQLDDLGNTSGRLSLSLGGPIYQGGRLTAQYRKAVANRDASRAALLQAAITVEQNVGIAWAQRAVAAAQLEASEGQIRAARVAFRGIREELELGARTTLDVLDAEQELLDAEANRISAYTDYYVATYAVLREMGLLTADHLRLAVVQYDPEAYYNAVKTAPIRKVSPQGEKLDRVLRGLGKY
jgi:outer membrane protein